MKRFLITILSLFLLLSVHLNCQEAYKPDLSRLYRITDSCFVDLSVKQSPRIGISASRSNSGSSTVPHTYIDAVLKAGGLPVIIPAITDGTALRNIVKDLDGLIMTGGEDVNPLYYKEEIIPDINEIDSIRDIYDLVLIKLATDRNIPVLGICRGEQIMNVAFGGTLYQDIPSQHSDKSIQHRQSQPAEEGTHTGQTHYKFGHNIFVFRLPIVFTKERYFFIFPTDNSLLMLSLFTNNSYIYMIINHIYNMNICSHFNGIEDPRIDRCKRHALDNIIFITIAAVLSGCQTWDEIEDYGKNKQEWLSTILDLSEGIPSHDTLNRFFAALNPTTFESHFVNWTQSICQAFNSEVISIDGKTMRGANRGSASNPIHIVSAWANDNNLVLGQIKTAEKSNEITAIPELLAILMLENRIITIDAMGCQKNIAEQIIESKADYVLALKDNHKLLKDDVISSFSLRRPSSVFTEEDFGHGRIETRKCSVITNLSFVQDAENWKALASIVKLESERIIKSTGLVEQETRYYISSLSDAEVIGKSIRSHWGIENKLHWVLDVALKEDSSAKRAGYAAQNYAMINKIVLNILRKDNTKMSINRKRNLAGWDNKYLEKLLKL